MLLSSSVSVQNFRAELVLIFEDGIGWLDAKCKNETTLAVSAPAFSRHYKSAATFVVDLRINLLIPVDICRSARRKTKSKGRNLVDPARCHMLVLKIKPCMSKYK